MPASRCDIFDASPVPFGLIRYGVAPDHQEVKNCINLFDRMFESNRSRLSLFCNVRIGSDLSVEELTRYYDAVLLSYGAHHPRHLSIPGVKSRNVMSGSDFVSWYNGVPNAKVPVLDDPNVVIIGNGNVALDCARILSNMKSLRTTDVPSDVLVILEGSKVKNIKIIGRRGPEDVSFTIKELREQFKVPEWNTTVEMDVEQFEMLKEAVGTMERRRKRLMNVLLDGVKLPEGGKQCRFLNFRIPEEIVADSDGRVCAIRVLNKRTDSKEEIPCGLLIYSIGYRTVVLDGIPVNDKKMIAMKDECRVDMPCGSLVYAAGWCAHGPRGVIVDTQQESIAVANEIASDLLKKTDLKGECVLWLINEIVYGNHCLVLLGSAQGAQPLLDARGINYITWDDWKRIDDVELKQGVEKGKIREKLTKFDGFIKKSV
uniref:NADPH:adrenodoxin oxidoreductase, mitochondrial n=1 Tax=Angiostrongylus cantonensis TaxID=6313 RepID=A0A158P6D4_ANGCA